MIISSSIKIEEADTRNLEMIRSKEIAQETKEIYEKGKSKIQSDAHRQGLDEQKSLIDKRPAEDVGKIIVEDNREIQARQKEIDREQKNISQVVQKNQKKLKDKTKIAFTDFNKLD